jgi:hypothetical protein
VNDLALSVANLSAVELLIGSYHSCWSTIPIFPLCSAWCLHYIWCRVSVGHQTRLQYEGLVLHTRKHNKTWHYLIFGSIDINCSCMWQDNVMGCYKGLLFWISFFAVWHCHWSWATTWGIYTRTVAKWYKVIWLIECDPILYSITKCFKA